MLRAIGSRLVVWLMMVASKIGISGVFWGGNLNVFRQQAGVETHFCDSRE
jgi:hypothetical protein